MIGKARRYKWLDFTDSVQVASQRSNWYSYIIQNNVRNTVLRTNLTDKANFHWWYASETLAWPRLFSFEWKVIGTTKAKRHTARSLLLNALKPEWNPNIVNRWFYPLQFQDDGWNERVAYCKVYSMPSAENWLDSPVIDFSFELLSESEKIYGATTHTITGTKAFIGGWTLSTTLPTTFWSFAWAIPVTNAWNWIAPCKIQIVWTATNPKIINTANGNKYRINWTTTNLVLDNRNLNNNPLENFIVTDNGVNIKAQRNSWADIFLDPWLNHIAVLTDNLNETPIVYITYRDTFIY